MTRVRRPAAEWDALIDEWRACGLSLPALCKRRGLNIITTRGGVALSPEFRGKTKLSPGHAADYLALPRAAVLWIGS